MANKLNSFFFDIPIVKLKLLFFSKISHVMLLLLLLILVEQCITLSGYLHSLAKRQIIQPWALVRTATNQQKHQPISLEKISQLALFGKNTSKLVAVTVANAPKSQINAQLNGVLASSDPEKSIVIITISGNQYSYNIGDMINTTQAKIRQIYPDRVILLRNGQDETLMLNGEVYGKPLPATSQTIKTNDLVYPHKLNRS
ncbi:MAG: type II secretion system protein N [Plesiomonas shigelloides]